MAKVMDQPEINIALFAFLLKFSLGVPAGAAVRWHGQCSALGSDQDMHAGHRW